MFMEFLFLLILIYNFREHWTNYTAQQSRLIIKPYFLIGKTELPPASEFSLEAKLHARKIEFIKLNIRDTYLNLSLKTIGMMKWASLYCNTARFIAKVDDDTFVNIDNLLAVVFTASQCDFKNTIFGRIIKPHDIPKTGDARKLWGVSNATFPLVSWPAYANGYLYIFTNDIIDRVLARMLQRSTPVVNIEDVFLTGIVRVLEDISLTDIPIGSNCRYDRRSRKRFQQMVGVHYYDYMLKRCARKRDYIKDKKSVGPRRRVNGAQPRYRNGTQAAQAPARHMLSSRLKRVEAAKNGTRIEESNIETRVDSKDETRVDSKDETRIEESEIEMRVDSNNAMRVDFKNKMRLVASKNDTNP